MIALPSPLYLMFAIELQFKICAKPRIYSSNEAIYQKQLNKQTKTKKTALTFCIIPWVFCGIKVEEPIDRSTANGGVWMRVNLGGG